ncbi:MAG TPA: zinc-dependent peptidase [Actinobacteria bacterium]|nr:zinc-dependent peptidase [Actinomycetota bacterium]
MVHRAHEVLPHRHPRRPRPMKRRFRKALATPFPEAWRDLLAARVSWYALLDPPEREKMENLTRMFLSQTRFEGAGGLEMDDQIRVVIAYQACLLVLNLGIELYRDVTAVIVYPSAVVKAGSRGISDGIVDDGAFPMAGEARLHGPVVVVWDAALRQARHPERGHNVVFHEFAHKIDMSDGAADGMPPLPSRSAQLEWHATMEETLRRVRSTHATSLDPYAGTNAAELFAVATEGFFDAPAALRRSVPALYTMLSDFYGQDPATRRRAGR